MKTHRIALLITVAALLAIPARAQTAGELLQKGIYTQETAGDLDGAIAIYRQIVNSGSSPRDIAAQAQYRLAQSLLQKGDLANGATEFSSLARNYADYSKLIGALAAEANRVVAEANRNVNAFQRSGTATDRTAQEMEQFERLRFEMDQLKAAAEAEARNAKSGQSQSDADEARVQLDRARAQLEVQMALLKARQPQIVALTFDSNSPITVKGVVFKVQVMNPSSLISVDPMDGSGKRYTFVVTGAKQTAKPEVTRQIIVTGLLATGGQMMPDGSIAAVATTITNMNGEKIYDRGQVIELPLNFREKTGAPR